MKTRRKLGWTLITVGLLTTGLALMPRGDAFDALAPPLTPEFAGTHWRTWALAGTEAESRRRVEALLTRERSWRLVGRTAYASIPSHPDVTVQHLNDATKDVCELSIMHPLWSPERIRV